MLRPNGPVPFEIGELITRYHFNYILSNKGVPGRHGTVQGDRFG
jgi:hypothetical protein